MTLLRLLQAGVCAALLAPPAAAQLLDPSFTAPSSLYAPGQVYALGPQQADGQRVVAGTFSRVNGTPTGQLVRLTATGALDQTFLQNVGVASNIYRIQRFASGQYLLASYGGNVAAAGLSRPEFMRLNADGTADATFNPGAGPFAGNNVGDTSGSAIQTDGKVVAVGYFDSFDNVAAGGIVRLNANGSVDPSFSTGTGVDLAAGFMASVAVQADGKILAGGSFTTFNGQAADGLVRLNANGSIDASFTSPLQNSYVEGIVLQPDGKILLYGSFSVNSANLSLVRLNANGTVDNTFVTSTLANGYVGTNSFGTALLLQPDGKIVVSGTFPTGAMGSLATLVRLNATGTLDGSFQTSGPSSTPAAIALQADGSVVVGGTFSLFNGSERPLQRVSSAGAPDASFTPSLQLPGNVTAVVRQTDGKLLIGGNFTELNGQVVHRLARLSDTGTLDAAYTAAAGVLPSPVTALLLQPDDKALVGTSTGLFRYTALGSRDTGFTSPFSSTTYALALQPDGRILLGCGSVGTSAGSSYRYLVRLSSTGAYDATFVRPVANAGPGVPGVVDAILVQPDGKIVVGGSFRLGSAPAVARVVRYEASGALDVSFNNTSAFTTVGGTSTTANRIFSLDIQPDGKLLVGGNFGMVDGSSRSSFARLTATGALDASFASNVLLTGTVYKVLRQPNGRVLLGGSYSSSSSAGTFSHLMRVLDNGQTDASFGPVTNPSSLVRSLLIQPDGAIVTAGNFTTIGGQTAVGVARILAANVLRVAAPAAVAARTAVWPVPAHGQLHVAPDFSAQPRSLTLLDAAGRPVRTRAVTGIGEQTLDLDALPTGLYLLQVRYAAGTVTRRVAVE